LRRARQPGHSPDRPIVTRWKGLRADIRWKGQGAARDHPRSPLTSPEGERRPQGLEAAEKLRAWRGSTPPRLQGHFSSRVFAMPVPGAIMWSALVPTCGCAGPLSSGGFDSRSSVTLDGGHLAAGRTGQIHRNPRTDRHTARWPPRHGRDAAERGYSLTPSRSPRRTHFTTRRPPEFREPCAPAHCLNASDGFTYLTSLDWPLLTPWLPPAAVISLTYLERQTCEPGEQRPRSAVPPPSRFLSRRPPRRPRGPRAPRSRRCTS
jgi:hypothetical protein